MASQRMAGSGASAHPAVRVSRRESLVRERGRVERALRQLVASQRMAGLCASAHPAVRVSKPVSSHSASR